MYTSFYFIVLYANLHRVLFYDTAKADRCFKDSNFSESKGSCLPSFSSREILEWS